MITCFKKSSLALIAGAAFAASTAVAVPISGSIHFDNGNFTTDTGDLGTATVLTFTAGGQVENNPLPTGDYSGTAGTAVSMAPTLQFDPVLAVTNPLWEFTAGGKVYSFALSTIVVQTQLNVFLNLVGTGIAYIDEDPITPGIQGSYEATNGTWSLTATTTGASSFSFNAASAVPDSGTTALLLGVGLLGVGFVSRRLNQALN